jgi:hypothetical protein
MRARHLSWMLGSALLLSACAADRVRTASGMIGKDVAGFQASLSTLQDELKSEQDDERGVINGTAARRDAADTVTRQMQVEWTIANARTGNDIFASLQSQGKEAIAALLIPATTPPPPPTVSFPIDKLSAVSNTLDQLSKGNTSREDAESLINYGIKVNKQLQTIEDKAKSTQKSPAATSPLASP